MFGYFQHELCNNLEHNDFFRFTNEFLQVVHANIPTIERVQFLDSISQQPANSSEESEEDRFLRDAMLEAADSGRPVLAGSLLFLPFPVQRGTVIAGVEGLDEYLVRKVGKDWIEGLLSLLLREFLMVKRACVDPLTGLLSSLHLEEYLDSETSAQQGALVLLSVYPKTSSSFSAKKYQHRTVSLLKSFVNIRFPLYYLGQSCFAIVCENCEHDFVSEFAPLLVNYFKREGCSRVHVSTVSFSDNKTTLEASLPVSESLMKKAWSALHIASKRGPFAFCHSSSLENVEGHPLVPPSIRLKHWLQRVARKCDAFSLLQFASNEEELLKSITEGTGGKGKIIAEENGHYLFYPSVDTTEIKNMAREIISAWAGKSSGTGLINVGISIYSVPGRNKSDQLLNCRKALCHADFLEPGSVVICDGVSFNISGDIYYGDGDLMMAVREYRKGLTLAPENGNLLNSLGVCYAQMNRHTAAIDCFQKACSSEADRFMAFYNLGLEQEIQGDTTGAIASLHHALDCPVTEEQKKIRKDISFQLAVLYTGEKQYKRALKLLQPWFESEREVESGGKALKYLGEIYCGLGRNQDAMKYLQQAMRYDEYDAEVLGLLGEMYLIENEGDDIALRFCEKAAELNPDSLRLQVRLAKAQIQCGDLMTAGRTLQPCLRNRKTRLAALQQKEILAREQGQARVAAKWAAKAEQYIAEISA